MTVIDFTAFIGRLATSSGETILPFFRTSLSIDNKSTVHEFDPVTEADRAAESGDATADQAPISPVARHCVGEELAASAKTPNMSGCWIRSTAPSPSSRLSIWHADRAGTRHAGA